MPLITSLLGNHNESITVCKIYHRGEGMIEACSHARSEYFPTISFSVSQPDHHPCGPASPTPSIQSGSILLRASQVISHPEAFIPLLRLIRTPSRARVPYPAQIVSSLPSSIQA